MTHFGQWYVHGDISKDHQSANRMELSQLDLFNI